MSRIHGLRDETSGVVQILQARMGTKGEVMTAVEAQEQRKGKPEEMLNDWTSRYAPKRVSPEACAYTCSIVHAQGIALLH